MKRLLIALLLILSVTMVIQAQDDSETITLGDTVEGTLNADTPQVDYTFSATAGDVIVVDLVSPEFDTYVYLLDADGMELTRNDDGGEGLNSRILGFEIPADGNYTVRVSSYGYSLGSNSNISGNYTLNVALLEVTLIEYGQTVSGTAEGFFGPFQFTAEEGTIVSATLVTESFDTQLTLISPSGREVAFGNYVDGTATTINAYTTEETGNYLLNTSGSGEYSLTLERVNATPVSLGESVTGTFNDQTQTLYFSYDNTTNGEVVDMIVDSGNSLDTVMTVTGPFGYEYARNEDSGDSVDPAVMSEILNDSGTYLIAVRAQNPSANLQGDVLFTVRPAELPSLEDGTVELTFDFDTEERLLNFEGVAGETVRLTIEVTGGDEFSSPFIELLQDSMGIANISMNGISRVTADVPINTDGMVNVRVQSYSNLSLSLTLDRLSDE